MTWHEILRDLAIIFNGVEWLAVRVIFILSVILLPIAVITLVAAARYLSTKENKPSGM